MGTESNNVSADDDHQRPTETKLEGAEDPTGEPGDAQNPRLSGRQPVRMALPLPDWFRTIRAQRRLTPEEEAKLSEWFAHQLAGSPLDPENFRNKPEDPKPE